MYLFNASNIFLFKPQQKPHLPLQRITPKRWSTLQGKDTPLFHQRKRIKISFPDILVKMEPLNLISEALTLTAAPGRQALNLESLHQCTVSDELQRGDFVRAYRPRSEKTEPLEMESTSGSVRKGANFLWECSSPLPSVNALRWENSRIAQISDQPGCENKETKSEESCSRQISR